MKQSITSGIVSLLIMVIMVLSGCAQKIEIPSGPTPEFEIYYSFGVGEKNVLDTRNNLYVKDMVCGASKEYDFKLTDSQKAEIYNSIVENDLLSVKEEFTKNCDLRGCQGVTPLSTASLRITVDGGIKKIKWSANYIDKEDQELQRFQNVVSTIQNIISQKETEMNIEQPECGYL